MAIANMTMITETTSMITNTIISMRKSMSTKMARSVAMTIQISRQMWRASRILTPSMSTTITIMGTTTRGTTIQATITQGMTTGTAMRACP